MRKLLLGSALAFAFVAPASADVMIENMLSGTGDNVVFDSFSGHTAIGSFNGMHTGVVDFTDLGNTTGFTAAANGNDIKIADTSDLQVVVKDSTNTNVLTTSTQVFSLKGSGDVVATVQATDGTFTFDLGALSASAQSGFTLEAINGETMSSLVLLDTGGMITDYEHYRIDVAGPLAATPLPAGLPLFAGGLSLMGWLSRRRKRSS